MSLYAFQKVAVKNMMASIKKYDSMKPQYRIIKYFLTGTLAGMTYEETTEVNFQIGKLYSCCVTKNKYRVIIIERL